MATNLRLKNVEIVLENEQKVYEMGQKVHGKIVVTFSGELPLSAIQIGIVCMSKIKHADETFDQKKLLESFYALPKKGKTSCDIAVVAPIPITAMSSISLYGTDAFKW